MAERFGVPEPLAPGYLTEIYIKFENEKRVLVAMMDDPKVSDEDRVAFSTHLSDLNEERRQAEHQFEITSRN